MSDTNTNQYPPMNQGQQYQQPPPPQQPQQTTVVVQGPPGGGMGMGGLAPFMSEFPTPMVCPACGAQITTMVTYEYGMYMWIMVVVLFFFAIILFWVPFVCNACKDAVHRCPNCGTMLGVHKKC